MTRAVAVAYLLLMLLLLAGCAHEQASVSKGANLLQSRHTPFDHPATLQSLKNLRNTGADHVSVVVFLEQRTPHDAEPGRAEHVTDGQLVAALRYARKAGLNTVIKPQVLVENGWAGKIAPPSEARWFATYRKHLVHYARIAQREEVGTLVIGTELTALASSDQWPAVIAAVREVFSGRLAYAAHGVEGVRKFAHWDSLDIVGVTLYPSLGDGREARRMRRIINEEISALVREVRVPVWIMEFGVPSIQGGLEQPWDWRRVDAQELPVDLEAQARGLDAWLSVLDKRAGRGQLDGTTFWAWENDPHAGGEHDRNYTPQNKPAEAVLRCHWAGSCDGRQVGM